MRPARAFTCFWRPPIFTCSTSCELRATSAWRRPANPLRFAKSLCDDVEFSPEDATRTDPEFLCQVLEAVVEAGATTLNIPDTVGYTRACRVRRTDRNHPRGALRESRM